MRKALPGLLLASAAAAVFLNALSCGDDDTCRIEIDAADEGDPIEVRLCGRCEDDQSDGEEPQGGKQIDVEFLPNDPDDEVGCRCVGLSCVFCTGECDDSTCTVAVVTDEASGCTDPTISLDLDDEDFAEEVRLPVTIVATSRLGRAEDVVFLSRGTPTPTVTETATASPTGTTTPTPTNTPLLGLP